MPDFLLLLFASDVSNTEWTGPMEMAEGTIPLAGCCSPYNLLNLAYCKDDFDKLLKLSPESHRHDSAGFPHSHSMEEML